MDHTATSLVYRGWWVLPGIQHDAMLQTKMTKHSWVPLDFKSPLDIHVGDNLLKRSEPKNWFCFIQNVKQIWPVPLRAFTETRIILCSGWNLTKDCHYLIPSHPQHQSCAVCELSVGPVASDCGLYLPDHNSCGVLLGDLCTTRHVFWLQFTFCFPLFFIME